MFPIESNSSWILLVEILILFVSTGWTQESEDDPVYWRDLNVVWSTIQEVQMKADAQQKTIDMASRNISLMDQELTATAALAFSTANAVDSMRRNISSLEQQLNLLAAVVNEDTFTLQNMTIQFNKLRMDIEKVSQRVDAIGGTEHNDVAALSRRINGLNKTTKRLHGVNQIWKGNFKIVKTIFQSIKKKLSFNMPSFQNV